MVGTDPPRQGRAAGAARQRDPQTSPHDPYRRRLVSADARRRAGRVWQDDHRAGLGAIGARHGMAHRRRGRCLLAPILGPSVHRAGRCHTALRRAGIRRPVHAPPLPRGRARALVCRRIARCHPARAPGDRRFPPCSVQRNSRLSDRSPGNPAASAAPRHHLQDRSTAFAAAHADSRSDERNPRDRSPLYRGRGALAGRRGAGHRNTDHRRTGA